MNQWDLPWSEFTSIKVRLPSPGLQTEVGNFLDRKIERIGALLSDLDGLGVEVLRQEGEAVARLVHAWPKVCLRYRLDNVEQGWSPECLSRPAEEDEVGVLKVGCVNYGRFRPEENKALPPTTQPKLTFAIRRNDLLMSRANTRELVGSVACVRSTGGKRLLLCGKLYRLAPNPSLRSGFLAAVLNSSLVRHQIEEGASGASSSMQNISQNLVRSLRIPDGALVEQENIERILACRRSAADRVAAETRQLRGSLSEYRDALITEAVTGKLDVTRLSEQQMDE